MWGQIANAPILRVRKSRPRHAKKLRPHNKKAEELAFKTSQRSGPLSSTIQGLSGHLGDSFKAGVSSLLRPSQEDVKIWL